MDQSHQTGFVVGDHVRVKSGVTDFDYADMPLGGWAGVVTGVETGSCTMCLVQWNQSTVAFIAEFYRKRCEEDGIDFREKWIDADDLIHDPGGSVWMQQPDKAAGQPASKQSRTERIRQVFGLGDSDPPPRVDEGSLGTYYEHLLAHLRVPFPAVCWQESQRITKGPRGLVVLHLLDKSACRGTDGILCEVQDEEGRWRLPLHKLQLDPAEPNYQVLDDYRSWFSECG